MSGLRVTSGVDCGKCSKLPSTLQALDLSPAESSQLNIALFSFKYL